ncbi:MAG: hypothetical protein COV59_05465 [Candidatus Magasanikbacteria bacterium CG11_big_fil_rev_8_21_14_0_20_39_34]|uniref:Flavodoxin-like domain-containing protein n=1 Tax=Candidatus Magasanikbacteria bacterium CG11_big_fil_rev_8_21_14_0_20_39_34 TaxID=1974653 RepID=A0A2H0N409_9BACT|nr:MAG: hypothetical protein COV59_05465 [Candidatus Magasanikbacteria bacterium CG11_big_fil_rev_8_21_14_0_20_39_34]
MNVLILYASNSGSNYHSAVTIADILAQKHRVVIKNASEVQISDIEKAKLIVMGSPSWMVNGEEGMPHEDVLHIMDALQSTRYSQKKFALFGCGDKRYTFFCGAVDHMENFVKKIQAKEVISPLKIDGFYFQLDESIKQIESWSKKLLKAL